MIVIVVFTILVFLYSLVSQRLERTVITAPIIFTATGILLALASAGIAEIDLDRTISSRLPNWGWSCSCSPMPPISSWTL